VDVNGSGHFLDIQSAVDAASAGDEVIVLPGTYTSSDTQVVDLLGKVITLRSSEGPEVTIIDGQSLRRGVRCDNGESSATTIEGFTITNGQSGDGAGIYVRNGSPSISECIFTGNQASDDGGGIFIREGSPSVTYCMVIGNGSTSNGGGIFIRTGNPQLANCTIRNNETSGEGGGIFCRDGGNASIQDCFIESNDAGQVGGGLASDESLPVIGGTSFCQNSPSHISGPWSGDGTNQFNDTCGPPCPGDLDGNGSVNVSDLLAVIAAWGACDTPTVHVIEQAGFVFIPSEITVARGDSIRWLWGGGDHTVTSGTLPCDADGLFDSDLDSDVPVFEWHVPADAPDIVDYFCAPHCMMDMDGRINIVDDGNGPGGCPEDIDGNGSVDVNDLLTVIGGWGNCP
jgi:plastocyanin